MSDGFYIGGFFGKTPETFIHLEDSGEIVIEATQRVQINAPSVSVDADNEILLTAPQIVIDGAITGGGSGQHTATFTGDVIADGISLKTHTHGGVESGSDSTGAPNS
jgi:phage baseplate assembly protein V